MSRASRSAFIWFASVSAAAVGAVAPAYAQAAGAGYEVVVTATGRETALQNVPIAVTALTGEALLNAGIRDLRQIEQLAPSYHFQTGQSNSAGTTAYIRGLGTGGDNPGFESAVGYFVDGVYRNRSGVALGELPEVQRVEVLRGPQGTLFGRNTSAGAISVVTAGPAFTPHHYGEITGGDRDMMGAKLGLNGPLWGEKLAGRIDAAGLRQDGYIRDAVSGQDINDKDRASLRGQLLFDISPEARLRLIADVAKVDEQCCGGIVVLAGPPATVINAIAPGAIPLPLDPEARVMTVSPARNYGEKIDENGYSGQLDWDLGFGELTSITAYRNWKARRNQDIDFT
ncbi:MAG: TonB-dependent receptor, partial [Hyphomonadaceae bacterium]